MSDKPKNSSSTFDTTVVSDFPVETLDKNIKELIALAQSKVEYSPVLMSGIMSRINILQGLAAGLQGGIKEFMGEILSKTHSFGELTTLAAVKALPSSQKNKL